MNKEINHARRLVGEFYKFQDLIGKAMARHALLQTFDHPQTAAWEFRNTV